MGKTMYLQAAEHEAYKSTQNFRHGAVVVKDGKIIGYGHNNVSKTSHNSSLALHSTHAEVDALKNSGVNCENAKLFVVRVTKECGMANSTPCARCRAYMKHRKISRVFYSSELGIESFYI